VALEIVWDRRAKSNFDKIISYLFIKFGENTTKEFVRRTYRILDEIAEFPEL